MLHLRNVSYSERLRSLGLVTLKYRRLREDLIQIFKSFHGSPYVRDLLIRVKPVMSTRSHPFTLVKENRKCKFRRKFLSQYSGDFWNRLPDFVVQSTSLNRFKSSLNQFLHDYPLKFDPGVNALECWPVSGHESVDDAADALDGPMP